MKKLFTVLSLTSFLALTACSDGASTTDTNENESQSDEASESVAEGNLIDDSTVTEGQWINFDGQEANSSSYVTTASITYDPSLSYELSGGAYVSYYDGDEFLETVLQNEAGPIKTVENADSIRLSFNEVFLDTLTLEDK